MYLLNRNSLLTKNRGSEERRQVAKIIFKHTLLLNPDEWKNFWKEHKVY